MRKSIGLNALLSVNPLTLPKVALIDKEKLPKSSGIYFVFNESQLLYIGKAQNLYSRWNDYEHHVYALVESEPTACISWLTIDRHHLAFAETLLVEYLNPTLNKVTPSAKASYSHAELVDAYYLGILKGIEIGKRASKSVDFTSFKLPAADPSVSLDSEPVSSLYSEISDLLSGVICPKCKTPSSVKKGKVHESKQRYFCLNAQCSRQTFTVKSSANSAKSSLKLHNVGCPTCPKCGTPSTTTKGNPEAGKQRYYCRNPLCTKKTFTVSLVKLLNSDRN